MWSWDAYSDPAPRVRLEGQPVLHRPRIRLRAGPVRRRCSSGSRTRCLKGSALHAPGSGSCHPFTPPFDSNGPAVRTNFANPALSDDKELMAADAWPNSPYRDNVYITWTIFDFSCPGGSYCESPIYFSKSTDGGVSWSSPMVISGSSSTYCHFGNVFKPSLDPHSCNFDQGSDPVVGPDGTIYVVFNNTNTSKAAVGARGSPSNSW